MAGVTVNIPGVGSTGSLPNTWTKDFTNLWMDGRANVLPKAADIVQMPDAGKGNHYIKNGFMVSVGNAIEAREGQALPFDSFVNGPTKTVYPTIFKMGLQFTKYAMDDDRYNIVKQGATKVGEGMAYTIEFKVWDIFNSGFVTTTRTGIDGLALFSASHPLYGVSGAVFSNLVSGSLSKSSLQTSLTIFDTMVNERNQFMYMEPAVLIHPPALRYTATELIESEFDPYSANNAVNSVQGTLTRMQVPFLTSTTAWFVVSKKEALDLYNYWFNKPEPRMWMDNNTGNVIFASEMRMATTFFRWRGTAGSTGV